MVYLVVLISAVLLVFCVWQFVRERRRRIECSKPMTDRNRG